MYPVAMTWHLTFCCPWQLMYCHHLTGFQLWWVLNMPQHQCPPRKATDNYFSLQMSDALTSKTCHLKHTSFKCRNCSLGIAGTSRTSLKLHFTLLASLLRGAALWVTYTIYNLIITCILSNVRYWCLGEDIPSRYTQESSTTDVLTWKLCIKFIK